MTFCISTDDATFKAQVESGTYPVAEFDHEAHLRLAYIYLVEQPTASRAAACMKSTLINLLTVAGIDPSEKYHETLTQAWVLAVQHVMNKSGAVSSACDFAHHNHGLQRSEVMMTHYSAEVLFSDRARQEFVEPDREPIPTYVDSDQ